MDGFYIQTKKHERIWITLVFSTFYLTNNRFSCFRLMPDSALTAPKEKKLTGRQWFENVRASVVLVPPAFVPFFDYEQSAEFMITICILFQMNETSLSFPTCRKALQQLMMNLRMMKKILILMTMT